jgi:hypothetical protein
MMLMDKVLTRRETVTETVTKEKKTTWTFSFNPDGDIDVWEIDEDGHMVNDQGPDLKFTMLELANDALDLIGRGNFSHGEVCPDGSYKYYYGEKDEVDVFQRLRGVFEECIAKIEERKAEVLETLRRNFL